VNPARWRRVKSVLGEALELDASLREDFSQIVSVGPALATGPDTAITFPAPGAVTTVSKYCGTGCDTFAYANNDDAASITASGEITGHLVDNDGLAHGFVHRRPQSRFVRRGGN